MRLEFNPISGQFDFVGTTTFVPKLIEQFVTDAGTAVNDLVVVSAANTVVGVTDNSSVSMPNGVFGVGISKPSATLIDVLFTGIVDGYSGLTAGEAVFVSTTGTPTHVVPATGTVHQIGFAISATSIFINLMQPMRRS